MAISASQARDRATVLLLHITERPEILSAFLAASGLQPGDLRAMARDGSAQLALLDFLAEEDARLLDVAQSAGMQPRDIMEAQIFLSGPGSHAWAAD